MKENKSNKEVIDHLVSPEALAELDKMYDLLQKIVPLYEQLLDLLPKLSPTDKGL